MPSAKPSATADTASGERWISLRELADIRGVSQHSATRLVRRNGWRRQRDNRGHVLALVPIEALSRQSDMPSAVAEGQPSAGPPDLAKYVAAYRTAIEAKDGEIAALHAVIGAKDGELTASHARADAATARAATAEGRADRAELGWDEERAQVDALRGRLDATQAQLAAAEQAAVQARRQAQAAQDSADAASLALDAAKAGGRLARAWRAWKATT
jgi:hypothetical protein